MKKITSPVCALVVAALLGSSLVFADGRGRGPDRDERWEQGHDNGYHRGWQHARPWDAPDYDQRDGRWNDRRPDYNARGPAFYRGGYIPREYRGPTYIVDYRYHHLSRPPYGHRWVQVGADYVLIAIATGVIADIILSR